MGFTTMIDVATLIREGKIQQAETELSQSQAESANNPQWHFARGRLLEAKGQGEDALPAYEKALSMDPNHQEAMFRLAFYLDLHGADDEAIKHYETLATKTPAHVNALINLAVIYEDRSRYEDAIRCIDRVLVEHPDHQRARMFAKDIESSMDMYYDENQERSRAKRNAILDTPIADFELSVRSRNCLRKMNINSLGDLLRISEAELLAYKNFGETSLNEIKAMLAQKGLRLGQLKEEAIRSTRPTPRRQVPEGSPDVVNKYLSEIEFSSRSRKCLQRLNLVTLGDLIMRTEAELLATKNFGQTSLNEIKTKLAEFGVGLRKPE